MPNVSGKKFAYTPEGKLAAKKYAAKTAAKKKATKPSMTKARRPLRPMSNSAATMRPGSETLYNMDLGKVYNDAAKRGTRKRQPMPGMSRRFVGRSNRVST